MKDREGYKMTELGEIPAEWEIVSTEDITTPSKSSIKIGPFGSQLKKEYLVDDGYKVYGQENIFNRNYALGNRYVTREKFEKLKSCELKTGDFVISMMGTVGKCDIIPEYIEQGIMDSHLIRLKIDDSKFNKNLLRQLIGESYIIKKQIKTLSVGGIMEGLSSTIIKKLKYPKPSLVEQQNMVSILSSVDEQIEITDNLIKKTKELKKGLMRRLLTKGIGHDRFKYTDIGRIPEEWEVENLSEIAEIIMGQSPDSSSYNEDGLGIPFFQGKTEFGPINPAVKKWCTKPTKIAEPLDILISVRAPVGDVNINNIQSCIGRGLGAARQTNKSYFKYIFYILQVYQNKLKKSSQGSTFQAINSADLKGLRIPVPELLEQKQIASILSSVDEQIDQYESKKEKLQELKKGLMQKLLIGRIRVIVDQI